MLFGNGLEPDQGATQWETDLRSLTRFKTSEADKCDGRRISNVSIHSPAVGADLGWGGRVPCNPALKGKSRVVETERLNPGS